MSTHADNKFLAMIESFGDVEMMLDAIIEFIVNEDDNDRLPARGTPESERVNGLYTNVNTAYRDWTTEK